MDDLEVDQCIQALEDVEGCVISGLGVGVLKEAVIGPHQVPSVGVLPNYSSVMGFDFVRLITGGCCCPG